jgi:hypothetical protein
MNHAENWEAIRPKPVNLLDQVVAIASPRMSC